MAVGTNSRRAATGKDQVLPGTGSGPKEAEGHVQNPMFYERESEDFEPEDSGRDPVDVHAMGWEYRIRGASTQ